MFKDPSWQVHGEETVAAYVPDSEFKGILERRIAVPPDHLAVLIRDGKVEFQSEGAHLAVGGIWQRVKEIVGGKHALRLLVADLKPFPVTAEVSGWSKDRVQLEGELTLELQLNAEMPTEIMGLVTNGTSLTRTDLFGRLEPHISERDVVAALVQHDAAELRANAGLQDQIQADVMGTCQRILGDLGVFVRGATISWAITEEEREQLQEARAERAARRAEFQHKRQLRELERAKEATTFEFQLDHEAEKVKVASEAELEQMLLDNGIRLAEARSAADRKAAIDEVAHAIEVARQQRMAQCEATLANAGTDLERKKIELQIRKLEMEFSTEQRRVEATLREEEELAQLRVADQGADVQHKRLKQLQELEMEKARAQQDLKKDDLLTKHSLEMESKRADSEAELEKLRLQSGMTEDQILAIQAGASGDVAQIFSERAKSAQGEEKEALLREMLDRQDRHREDTAATTGAMFDKAIDRIADVASTTRRSGSGAPRAGAEEGEQECPKCHHVGPLGDRFCSVCGNQLRT